MPQINTTPKTAQPSIQDPSLASIVVKLQGQHLRIPNLAQYFAHWPEPVKNKHYNELVKIHDRKIAEWFPDTNVRNKMTKIDLPLFASTWWPDSSLDRLLGIMYYTLWLFAWDDNFDEAPFDLSIPTQFDKIIKLHHLSLDYVTYHLGLGPKGTAEPKPPTHYSVIFAEAGKFFRKSLNERQRRRFLKEISFYMECCLMHQEYIRSGKLPASRAEYWRMRSGDSAYLTYCAITEYMMDLHLPEELFDMEEMKTLWFESMRIIIYVNDPVSFKKEMGASFCSLIPITMNETGHSLQEVINLLVGELQISIKAVDTAGNNLLKRAKNDPKAHADVEKFLYGMQTPITGNWSWSLATGRYGVTQYTMKDGSLDIPL